MLIAAGSPLPKPALIGLCHGADAVCGARKQPDFLAEFYQSGPKPAKNTVLAIPILRSHGHCNQLSQVIEIYESSGKKSCFHEPETQNSPIFLCREIMCLYNMGSAPDSREIAMVKPTTIETFLTFRPASRSGVEERDLAHMFGGPRLAQAVDGTGDGSGPGQQSQSLALDCAGTSWSLLVRRC